MRRVVSVMSPSRIVLAAALALSVATGLPGLAKADVPLDPISEVVAKVSPAVVGIAAARPPKAEDDTGGPKTAGAAAERPTFAIGSGFIIDPAGYISTNKHVAENATALIVTTADGQQYKASIVGMPAKSDMALLKINAGHPLPAVKFGDSDKMRAGDTVIAIGSPFGFNNTVTAGIVSAVNRDIMESPFDDYIQTDASINHGNSGGPLFNMAGEVIGMNSVIFSPSTGSSGLGFAIPSTDLQFVYDRLMRTGEVKAGMLPVYTQQVSWMLQQALKAPDLHGALVSHVHDDDGHMMQGKIKAGDVIMAFNGQKITDPRDLARKVAWAPIGSDAELEICRGGEHSTVHLTIHAWPESKPASPEGNLPKQLGLQLAAAKGDKNEPVVTVSGIDPAGTAAYSGIQTGDTILEVQQTPVSQPAEAEKLFSTPSAWGNFHFVAVLVEHDKKAIWMPLAIPE
jgi:serine protease Do